jgi:hypothetical protein
MRIRDAITKPVLAATAGAIVLSTIVAIAIVGTTAPSHDSFGATPQPPAPLAAERPLPTATF